MKITLITPHIGRKSADYGKYVNTWQMEPLPMATLAGITPADIEVAYFDERMEPINFDDPTDLVGIAVETYTAKRAYEISAEYHRRGIPVILGGYQAMLAPDEAELYADSIMVGYAEPIWEQVLADAKNGRLQRRYVQNRHQPYTYSIPRREIFGDRRYFKLSCVETGRGCPQHCEFCSIAAATTSTFNARPIDSIVQEIQTLRHGNIFFVDDNFVSNPKRALELCRELIPQKLSWVGQGTLHMARDEKLLKAMADSGCRGMLIGFESLDRRTLGQMGKEFNHAYGEYRDLIKKIHSYGISIYGTFIFGYDIESQAEAMETVDKAIEWGLGIAAFNHLLPFPGTPLYNRLRDEGRLVEPEWWLSPTYKYGDIAFTPTTMSRQALRELCMSSRRRFYSFPSITKRLMHVRGNFGSLAKGAMVAGINFRLRKEVDEKDSIPLGNLPTRPVPLFKPTQSSGLRLITDKVRV